MESKTKHRILGLLVFIGLLLILLLFFQSGRESLGEPKIVKAPPFPESTTQIAMEAESTISEGINSIGELPQNQDDRPSTPLKQSPQSISEDTIRAIKPSVINANSPNSSDEADIQQTSLSNDKVDNTLNEKILDESMALPTAQTAGKEDQDTQVSKTQQTPPQILDKKSGLTITNQKVFDSKKINALPLEDDGLFKLQNAAWVIQIGSFRNKTNALKLVNQLRAKGFKAFIQQVSTTLGDSTRVFVGPEAKHSAARAVAGQLENELHIHGIVVSYKPLTL